MSGCQRFAILYPGYPGTLMEFKEAMTPVFQRDMTAEGFTPGEVHVTSGSYDVDAGYTWDDDQPLPVGDTYCFFARCDGVISEELTS